MRIALGTNISRQKTKGRRQGKNPWLCRRYPIELRHDNALPPPVAATAIDLPAT